MLHFHRAIRNKGDVTLKATALTRAKVITIISSQITQATFDLGAVYAIVATRT